MGGRGGARPLACLERLWNCAAALLSLRRIRVNTVVEVVCVRVTCCGGECEADPGPLRPSVECRSTFLCGGFVSCCIARGGRGARVRCSFLRETRKKHGSLAHHTNKSPDCTAFTLRPLDYYIISTSSARVDLDADLIHPRIDERALYTAAKQLLRAPCALQPLLELVALRLLRHNTAR